MNVQRFIKKNASTILTCLGAGGVVATAVMAVKATPKAMSLLDDAIEEKGDKLTTWEKVVVAGPTYAPAVITGAATIACIFGSNIISKHQQATLMSAYALLDNSYREYKNKVDELYGEEAGENVRSEIAKDKYTGDDETIDNNQELFFDFYSGRYFNSTQERVLMALYELNRRLACNFTVNLNEYYSLIGLEAKPEYENLGWNQFQLQEMYWSAWIDFALENTVIEEETEYSEGVECTIVHMQVDPTPDYDDEW